MAESDSPSMAELAKRLEALEAERDILETCYRYSHTIDYGPPEAWAEVFTEDGEFIEEWPDIYDPVNIWLDEDGWVWVISARLNRVLKYSTAGQLQYHWGTYGQTAGTWEGGLSRPHQLDMDETGAIYIASYDGAWVNKFLPKPGADPSKLIGTRLLLTN